MVGIKQMIPVIALSNKFADWGLYLDMQHDFSWEFNGHTFHGITWQPEHYKRVMVIIHGIGEHVERYAPLAEFLMRKVISLRGSIITAMAKVMAKEAIY